MRQKTLKLAHELTTKFFSTGTYFNNYFVSGAQSFSRKHPLSCWLSTILVIFAGGILCNALLGEPMLAPLKNSQQLLIATVVWLVCNSELNMFDRLYTSNNAKI